MVDQKYLKEEIIIDYENESMKYQTKQFFHHLPTYTKDYVISLFPIATWLHRYNLMVRHTH
jgi:sodium-independent sulfate anion transporter 11